MTRPAWLPNVDLTAVTRNSDVVTTTIELRGPDGAFHEWLRFGELSRLSSQQNFLGAYYSHGVTDLEHDSAYAIHFEVIGVKFQSVNGGHVEFQSFIAGAEEDAENFKVPAKSIESLDMIEGEFCDDVDQDYCDLGRHIMTEFTPKADVQLWKKLRGREIRITISPVIKEEG